MTQATFKQVSKDEFFAALKADPRDVMPNHDEPFRTVWQAQRNGLAFGVTTPGWKGPFCEAPTYSIRA